MTVNSVSSNFFQFQIPKEYQFITDEVLTLIKNLPEKIDSENCHPNTVFRIIEVLVRFDSEIAIKLAERIDDLEMKIGANLLIAQYLVFQDPQRSLFICDQLFNDLLSMPLKGEVNLYGLIFIAKTVEQINKTKSKVMTNKCFEKYCSNQEDVAAFKKDIAFALFIKLLPPKYRIKLFKNFSFDNYEDILKKAEKPLEQQRNIQQILKDPESYFKSVEKILEPGKFNAEKAFAKQKICINLWSHFLSQQNFVNAKTSYDLAYRIAYGSENSKALALMGKKISQMGYHEESQSLIKEAIKRFKIYPKPRRILFDSFVPSKIKDIDPKTSSELFLDDLEKLIEDVGRNTGGGKDLLNEIADKAPPYFWQNYIDQISKCMRKADPSARVTKYLPQSGSDVRLLFDLKIFQHCDDPFIQRVFVQQLRKAVGLTV